ncbi:MAG: hypothetical protein WCB49_11055 [Gammaproteobacteria bacterium]
MLTLTSWDFRQNSLGSFARLLAVPLLAFSFAFAPSFLPTYVIDTAEAASVKKKAKVITRIGHKALRGLERAGRKAQRRRGIVGKIGRGVAKSARTSNRGLSRVDQGIDKAARGTSRVIGRSRVGRAAQKGWRKAGRWQNKQINRAFRKCRGRACNFGKNAAKFAAPF